MPSSDLNQVIHIVIQQIWNLFILPILDLQWESTTQCWYDSERGLVFIMKINYDFIYTYMYLGVY